MLRPLGILCVCTAAALAATATAASLWAPDPRAHDRYSDELRRVQAVDARLNEHVVSSQAGLSASYEPISADVADLKKTVDSLQQMPAFLDGESRADLAARLTTLSALVQTKADRVETFQVENAVLRNSLRFFPVAATEMADRAEKAGEPPALAAALRGLMRDVLLFNLLPAREMAPRVERDVTELDAWPLPAPERADLTLLLSYARVVVDRKPRVDSVTSEIVALPVLSAGEALRSAYEGRHRAAREASDRWRSAMFVLALLTLGLGAAYVTARLRRSVEQEKELRQMKSQFVSVASHELRTPLAIILSSAELLETYGDRWPEEKRRSHLARIVTAVKGMGRLLEGVLAIGRLDTSRTAFEPQPVDVERFCAETVEAVLKSDGAGRQIDTALRGIMGPLRLDERLLRQVLSNLLSNALKYSPAGGAVTLDVAMEEGALAIAIEDHGIGIPEQDRRDLFESFHRGSNVGKIHGSGLGMAIVKRALDMHGGSIEVESRAGSGTRVTVHVPVRPEPA